MSVRRTARAWLATLAGLTCLVGLPATATSAAADSAGCPNVTLVFARGSGQTLGAGEATRFLGQTTAAIGPGKTVNTYELGTAAQGGARYPAVGVGTDTTTALLNLIG